MQNVHVQQSFNLLGEQQQPDKNKPPSQLHLRKDQVQRTSNFSNFFVAYGTYLILFLLACVLVYDMKDFLAAAFNVSNNAIDRNKGLYSNAHDENLEKLREKEKQYKKLQSFKDSQQKNLRIIELQKEMLKINSALRSKQEYDNGLIVKQLQNLDHSKLKYWNSPQQTTFSSPQQPPQLHNDDLKYIIKELQAEQVAQFPKIVWMYIEDNISAQSNLTQLLIGNLAEYLELQGYDFYLVGQQNFRYLISNRHQEQLGYVLVDLWHLAYETNLTKNLKDHTFTIKKHLLSLIMLAEMGGILIDREAILTEPLDWLENFKEITLANKGRAERPNIIGFYHPNYTDSMEAIEMQDGSKKQVQLYPPLDPYFLAVSKQGMGFIEEVLQHYYILLEFPNKIKEIIAKYQLSLRELSGDDPYYEAIYFAFSWVIKLKQLELQQTWQQSGKQGLWPLAIDHYGIYGINRIYGPLKYRFLFSQMSAQQIYEYLTRVDYDDLSEDFGKISYISFIPFSWKIEELAGLAQDGKVQYQIYSNSFMGRFVYKNFSQTWITDKNPVKHDYWKREGLFWDSLPKKIWVYMQKKSMVGQLCLLNILQSASYSNFQVNVLTPSNLENYLSKVVLQSLEKAYSQRRLTFKNRAIESVPGELLKLAILSQHGGVWLDLPVFALQSFNWIREIHHNQYVINKRGRLPKTLLFYHPIQSGFPYDCQESCNFKQRLSFKTSVIISEPNGNLFSTWLKELMENLSLSEGRFEEKLSAFNMSYKSIQNGGQLSQLTLDYIQQTRNRRFGHRLDDGTWALSEFQVWAISSFTGLEKFKEYTNFDVGFDSNNAYLWSMPARKASTLLGQIRYLIHLSGRAESFLNREFHHRQQFSLDPQSLIAQYLMNQPLLKQLLEGKGAGAIDFFKSKHGKKQP